MLKAKVWSETNRRCAERVVKRIAVLKAKRDLLDRKIRDLEFVASQARANQHWWRCLDCGEKKADVRRVTDPYQEDVNGKIIKKNLCEVCLQEYKDSI